MTLTIVTGRQRRRNGAAGSAGRRGDTSRSTSTALGSTETVTPPSEREKVSAAALLTADQATGQRRRPASDGQAKHTAGAAPHGVHGDQHRHAGLHGRVATLMA